MKCSCQLFEFKGILCRHVISILIFNKVTEVPKNYILDRWRKDVKRGYQNIKRDYGCEEKRSQYNNLIPLVQEVQGLGSENDNLFLMFKEILKETNEKFIAIIETNSKLLPQTQQGDQVYEIARPAAKMMLSPLKLQSRGRPRSKRMQSKGEQIVKKVKAKSLKKV